MKTKGLKLMGAVLLGAAMLTGTGCGTQQSRAANEQNSGRRDSVAVELDDGQPDPWWEVRPPSARQPRPVNDTPERTEPERKSPPPMEGNGTVSAAYPTGDAKTSAILVEKFFPTVVNAGTPFDYQIRVTNLTSLDLDNVRIWDNVPGNFELQSSDPEPDNVDQGNIMWNLGSFNPREVKTINVRGSASEEGTISACARVEYDTSLCNQIQVVQPALNLAVAVPAEALICDTIPVKYTVCNNGSGAATNVEVNATLPEGLTNADGGRNVHFTVARLASGECQDFTVNATAAATGTYSVAGQAMADGNLSADAMPQSTVVYQPTLTISLDCPGRVLAGANVPEVPITITVTNTGDAASTDTVVEAAVPAGSTFVRASDEGAEAGGTVRWNLGSLAAGATRSISFSVQPGERSQINATARVQGSCANVAQANCTTDVLGVPAVLLEVVDLDDPIEVGNNVTYRITVTNQGSAPDNNVKIVCTLEDQAEFVSATGQHTVSGKTVTFAPVPVLNAKERATFEVTVKAVDAANVRFGVTMTSDNLDRPVIETESTNFYK